MRIDVYPLPDMAYDLPLDGIAIAIDQLRATTTITTALANGARRVIPFETVDQALQAKSALQATHCASELILGGEREGKLIPGFDLDNSPCAYTRERVQDKTLLFTTTNGTRTILACRGVVLLASFVNLDAVVRRVLAEDRELLSILCAGTGGNFTEEDLLVAGALVERISRAKESVDLNVQAEVSSEQWRVASERPLVESLRASLGGRNLRRIGLDADVVFSSNLNAFDVVAEFRVGEVRLEQSFTA
ncbi:MAG: 2-phosphosulfolactate phosphatase [Planctomycetia bacterium]|nr:2-phosphosulfolactate phosphatase [Planctomycetia bacterium]